MQMLNCYLWHSKLLICTIVMHFTVKNYISYFQAINMNGMSNVNTFYYSSLINVLDYIDMVRRIVLIAVGMI